MKVGLSRAYLNIDAVSQCHAKGSQCAGDTLHVGDARCDGNTSCIDGPQCFGGNQQWFDGMLARCGCGIIAAADTVWYLRRGKNHPSLETYQKYIRGIRWRFPMIPFRGMPGAAFAFFLNRYLKHLQLDYRACWGVLPWNIHKVAAVMLAQDIPVPFCVGPCLVRFFDRRSKGLKLYTRKADGSMEWTRSIYSHFMVMTQIEDDWAKVSSWGQTFYIRLSELEKHAFFDFFGILTNITQIRFRFNDYKKSLFD